MKSNGSSSMAMRIRVVFAKGEPMRFTSHLDLYRAWERLLRRAGMQLVFSQGYNPRPKLQLAAPLPLGMTSQAEIIDFWLSEEPQDIDQLKSRLVAVQPPGIEIQTVTSIEPAAPPLQKQVSAAQYHVILLDQVPQIDQRIDTLINSEEIIRQRRGKSYDLRPLIKELNSEDIQTQSLHMILAAQEGNTGRPEEVLLALEIQPENSRIQRIKLLFQD